jgi:hypothetical protein
MCFKSLAFHMPQLIPTQKFSPIFNQINVFWTKNNNQGLHWAAATMKGHKKVLD